MPYTQPQQSKIDAAQKKLDDAKAAYQAYANSYNEYGALITTCFDKKRTWYDASQAATWFNPSRTDCVGSSPIHTQGCSNSDKNACQGRVDTLNSSVIPALRAAYANMVSAQANFDKVIQEVAFESQNDPANVLAQHQAEAAAAAAAATAKYKWIFAIVTVVIIGGAIIVYRKLKK